MVHYLNPNYCDLPGRRPESGYYRPAGRHDLSRIDVSILTPYYNTEEFFFETVASIRAQSLQNWEWIIVDDGSTDGESVERLRRAAAADERIQVVRQTNAGPGAARNAAFRASSGRYVCLLDSDDMVEPTYLEKCVWFLDSNPEFSFCNAHSVVFGDQEYLWANGFERGKEHLHANSGPPISVIRKHAYSECGGFDESIRFGHEDWDFWLAMARSGHWGYTIREYLQWYRKRGNGRFEQIMRSGNVNDEFEKLMLRKYSGLENTFPNPQRRHPQPYETLQSAWPANNPLQPNENGRRIMFILPWMVIGGADRVNLDLIEGLITKGHQVTVCATLAADHSWEHKFAELTPDVFVLPNILHLTDYPRFLAYLIHSRQIDTVVVSGSTVGYQLLPYLRAAAPQTAFLDLSHVEEPHWMNGGHPRFGVGYQDALDINVVTTRHLAKWMEQRGADPARIRVMYTGVRPPPHDRSREARDTVRARLGINDNLPVIVFAGRICEQKRPALLAEVLKEARDAGLRFQALIIGDGELRPLLESLLDKYSLRSCVQMLGSLTHDQWLETLVGSDILLMPSQYEGISIALLEAMAAGVVPVVARVGGQEEIVGDNTGYLIAHGDSELQDYVRALRRLTDGTDEWQAKSTACRALMASTFSRQKTVDDLERFMSEAHEAGKERRCQFSMPMGQELASLALENKRLSDAVDWLWKAPRAGDTAQQPPGITLQTAPVVRLVLLLCQTRLGRYVLSNAIVKNVGRSLIARLETSR